MKISPTGVLILDCYDIFLISMTTTMGALHVYKVYQKRQNRGYNLNGKVRDPIVLELEQSCRKIPISLKTKAPILWLRSGADVPAKYSAVFFLDLLIKNKKLAEFLVRIRELSRKRRTVRMLVTLFGIAEQCLSSTGLLIGVGGNCQHVHIIIAAFSGTAAGAAAKVLIKSPYSILLPLLPTLIRGTIALNAAEEFDQCKLICEAVAETYNNKTKLEMGEYYEKFVDVLEKIGLPDLIHAFECEKSESSDIVARYLIRSALEAEKARNRIQSYSKFVQDHFPECAAGEMLDKSLNYAAKEIIKVK